VDTSTLARPVESKPGLAFQLRGTMQTVLCLRLLDLNAPDLFDKLLEKVAHAPDFFHNAPLVIDVAGVVDDPPDVLGGLIERLRQMRLVPVGIRNGSSAWQDAATELGLAIFAGGADDASSRAAASKPAPKEAPARRQPSPPAASTLLIQAPVRGGQQIVNQGDIIVSAPVSPGAELAATGHIHIYGPLRGRVFAGTDGDESAMIFCDSLNAELISIAGVHLVNEELDAQLLGRRCRISLRDQQLQVQPLD